jgi:hypothetical protein
VTTETQAGASDTQTGGPGETGVPGTPGEGKPNAEGQPTQVVKTEGDKVEGQTKVDVDQPIDVELKLPEGIELDQASLDNFKALVNDKALTPAQRAQKVVDLAVKREADRLEMHTQRVAAWADEVKADKDLGGDKLEETLSVARKAIDLGTPELKEFLNTSGLGNHPAVVRWAYAVGKALSEDHFVPGNGGNPPSSDHASRLYGNKA